MIRRPPRSTLSSSSAASDVYKRQFVDTFDGLVLKPLPATLASTTSPKSLRRPTVMGHRPDAGRRWHRDVGSARGWRASRRLGSVRALRWYPGQQPAYLSLPVAAVPTEGPDGRQLAGLGPPGNRLPIHAEHRGHLGRGEQRLRLRSA